MGRSFYMIIICKFSQSFHINFVSNYVFMVEDSEFGWLCWCACVCVCVHSNGIVDEKETKQWNSDRKRDVICNIMLYCCNCLLFGSSREK